VVAGRLCDDGQGWMADVEYVVLYPWGYGKHLPMVPPERVRVAELRARRCHGLFPLSFGHKAPAARRLHAAISECLKSATNA
jgi:hypothetical protein